MTPNRPIFQLPTRMLPVAQAAGTGTAVPMAAGVVALTLAGMLWLHQSSALTASGLRIARLKDERSALLEQRAAVLMDQAHAGDPRRLEARARELGFRPATTVQTLAVEGLPAIGGPMGEPAASFGGIGVAVDPLSPLALIGGDALDRPADADGQTGLAKALMAAGLTIQVNRPASGEGAAQ